jgi:hypothetical protein
MLGGGHVRRSSVGSIFEASPCVRVEKRKHSVVHTYKGREHHESPNKARMVLPELWESKRHPSRPTLIKLSQKTPSALSQSR